MQRTVKYAPSRRSVASNQSGGCFFLQSGPLRISCALLFGRPGTTPRCMAIALNIILVYRKIWHLHPRSNMVLFIVCRKFLQYLICYIIGLLAFFQQLCYHHLLLLDLFLMSLCILHIHLLVLLSDMVISILKVSVLLILILVVLLDKFAVIMVFIPLLNL